MKFPFLRFLFFWKKPAPPPAAPAPARVFPPRPPKPLFQPEPVTFVNDDPPRTKPVVDRMMKDRIILIGSVIDQATANEVIARMLFLQMESPSKPITLYINSPGGAVMEGLAIFDTIRGLQPPVHTLCIGLAHSMAAVILCSGAKGGRLCAPEGRVAFSLPKGNASDSAKQQAELERFAKILIEIVAKNTGRPAAAIRKLFTEETSLVAEEARQWGIVDQIASAGSASGDGR